MDGRQKMRRMSFDSESGVILPMVVIFVIALTIVGLALLHAAVLENKLAMTEVRKNQAFYLAEAGLERTMWNLGQHFEIDFESRWPGGEGAWPPVDGESVIYGIPVDWDSDHGYWILRYGEYDGGGPDAHKTNLGAGFYEVRLYYEGADEIRIESTGTENVKNISRTVQIYMGQGEFYPFDAAIFAGESAVAGSIINGNVRVHGTIVILGEHLGETAPEPAVELIDLLGDAGVRNNYEGMELQLEFVGGDPLMRRIPECPEVEYGGDLLESLRAKLHVRYGKVTAGGDVTIGTENIVPGIKGPLDGTYVDGGFTLSGNAALYSDEENEPFDLVGITFPTLTEPGPEDPTMDRIDYLQDSSNSISLPDTVTEISSNVPSFWHDASGYHPGPPPEPPPGDPEWSPSGPNYIVWDQTSGLLTIGGIVNIPVDELKLGEKNTTIEYNGSGIIVVAERDPDPESETGISGAIRVHGHLLAQGQYVEGNPEVGGFPNHVLGLITNDLHIAGPGETHSLITGAFFAENVIRSDMQNEIAGTFICRRFDIGNQVPRLYQVPALKDKIPVGMPAGRDPLKYLVFTRWSEVLG